MTRVVILNNEPYVNGQEDPREALRDTLAFSVDDWGATRAMAWVWGIVEGWDPEAMAELAEQYGWDRATTERLDRLHAAFDALTVGETPTALRGAADKLEGAMG
jgi:ABC-type microcin C transport system permease subunit YejB